MKERQICDGALIACEVVQWLKIKKKMGCLIKLDFHKVYDRVRWSFIDLALQRIGFDERWRAWIKECIATPSMSIMVNGTPSKPFKMERGLHQGDPLSPFLFVLVAKVLNKSVVNAMNKGFVSPFKVGKRNVDLSHLQFAGNTIIFCPQSEETIRNYRRLRSMSTLFWEKYPYPPTPGRTPSFFLEKKDLSMTRYGRRMVECG